MSAPHLLLRLDLDCDDARADPSTYWLSILYTNKTHNKNKDKKN